MTPIVSRRHLLTATAGAAIAANLPSRAQARYDVSSDTFPYEVQRTPDEWRALLGDEVFEIMREGATEVPKSSELWDSTAPGIYSCKGCDLPLYDAKWKTVLDIGWLFFGHAEPNSLLTGLDYPDKDGEDVSQEVLDSLAMMEVHCRRCGSHHGHIVSINDKVLHCVNGGSMNFEPAKA